MAGLPVSGDVGVGVGDGLGLSVGPGVVGAAVVGAGVEVGGDEVVVAGADDGALQAASSPAATSVPNVAGWRRIVLRRSVLVAVTAAL